MTQLIQLLLALPMLWLPPGEVARETPEQYRQRVETIASAAQYAADQVGWQWGQAAMRRAVLSTWYGETRFDLEIHQGGPGRHGSDKGRSKCLGQIHQTVVPRDVWEGLGGTHTAATRRCALWTARFLARAQRLCAGGEKLDNGRLAETFAGYGGRRCKVRQDDLFKVRTYRKLQ